MDFKLKEKNAALWKRIAAYIIDFLIVSFILLPFKDYFAKFDFINLKSLSDPNLLEQVGIMAPKFLLVSFIVAVLTILYWALFEYYLKQSIGKMIFKIRVVSIKRRIKFWQCFLRNVSKASLLVLFIDFIFVFFNKENQRFFEKVSDTKVIERGFDI